MVKWATTNKVAGYFCLVQVLLLVSLSMCTCLTNSKTNLITKKKQVNLLFYIQGIFSPSVCRLPISRPPKQTQTGSGGRIRVCIVYGM